MCVCVCVCARVCVCVCACVCEDVYNRVGASIYAILKTVKCMRTCKYIKCTITGHYLSMKAADACILVLVCG